MAKRDQLQEALSKQLANLRQRIEQTIKAHTKHLSVPSSSWIQGSYELNIV